MGRSIDSSTIDAGKIVDNILIDIGLNESNFVIKPCNNTNNAVATIYNNKRYILFDDHFLKYLAKGSNQNFTYLFILAHEIAHHLNGHTLLTNISNQESRKNELECDRFAGYILQKKGANIVDIKNALIPLGNPSKDGTHPQLTDRINSATKGYNDALNQSLSILLKYKDKIQGDYENYRYSKSISDARKEMINYQLNNDKKHLKNSIRNYLIADNTKKDPIVVSELATAYRLDGDYRNSQIYYELAYEITKKPIYMLLAWEFCETRKTGNCIDYEKEIDKINYQTLNDFNSMKLLARYYDSKFLKTENKQYNKLSLAIIKLILDNRIYEEKDNNITSLINYINILNDESINYNRIDEINKAYSTIKKAYSLYDENFLKNKYSPEETIKTDEENFIQLLLNKALYELRLERWLSCEKTLLELDKFNLDYNRKSNYHYYKGRVYLGTGRNKEAIGEFTRALELVPNEMIIYYYRARANFNIPNNKLEYWSDLNISCNGGFKPSCELINKIKLEQ